MSNRIVIDAIHAALRRNESETERLERERQSLEHTLSILSRDRRSPKKKSKPHGGIRIPSLPDGIHVEPGTKIADAVVVIARSIPDDTVNTTQVARYLVEAGVTTVDFDTVRATVHGRLNEGGDFVRLRRGWYRYEPSGHSMNGHSAGGHEDCGDDCDVLVELMGRL